MDQRRQTCAPTTLVATALVLILTGVYGGLAGQRLLTRSEPQTVRESALGLASGHTATSRTLTAVIVLAVCVVSVLVAVGLARRRQGSRHAGIALFLLLGVVSLGSSLAGFTSDPPAPNAWLGVANGVACLAVCGLLLHPSTAHDFSVAEVRAARRRETARPG